MNAIFAHAEVSPNRVHAGDSTEFVIRLIIGAGYAPDPSRLVFDLPTTLGMSRPSGDLVQVLVSLRSCLTLIIYRCPRGDTVIVCNWLPEYAEIDRADWSDVRDLWRAWSGKDWLSVPHLHNVGELPLEVWDDQRADSPGL